MSLATVIQSTSSVISAFASTATTTLVLDGCQNCSLPTGLLFS